MQMKSIMLVLVLFLSTAFTGCTEEITRENNVEIQDRIDENNTSTENGTTNNTSTENETVIDLNQNNCEERGGTWIEEREQCHIEDERNDVSESNLTQEECERRGGTWIEERERCHFESENNHPNITQEHCEERGGTWTEAHDRDGEYYCNFENVSRELIQVVENPDLDKDGFGLFTKYSEIFGIKIYAEAGISDEQVIHAATVFAELLDNDENGLVDDEILLRQLQEQEAIMPMFDYEESPAFNELLSHYEGEGISAVLFADEVDPTRPGHWGSDASVEEIMHTINHVGHVNIYPDAFGLEPGSSLLSAAMDEARGGQFVSHPSTYPNDAWYHYDDETCDYECMAIEYMYWAQVSNMGILDEQQTCEGIANEWEPCSKELLQNMDVLVYELITDSQYKLPQNAPDGVYAPTYENEQEMTQEDCEERGGTWTEAPDREGEYYCDFEDEDRDEDRENEQEMTQEDCEERGGTWTEAPDREGEYYCDFEEEDREDSEE